MESKNLLKLALTTPLTLVFLDYSKKVGDIILAVDPSIEGWGGILM